MKREPAFYLTSSESRPTLSPRGCWIEEKLRSSERHDAFLRVKIEPPIIGQPFGLGDASIHEVVLATRYAGSRLDPINEWPITVFVCRMLRNEISGTGKVAAADLELMLIGELYQNIAEATKAIAHEPNRI